MDADTTMDAMDDLPCGSLAHRAHSLGGGDIRSSMNQTQTLETPQ